MTENQHLFDTRNIQDLLDIWKSRAKPIVIWAGAGLSAPAKLPTWEALRNVLTREALKGGMSLNASDKIQLESKIKAIQAVPSHWKAFELLEDLGPATFQGSIRRMLVDSLRCPVPLAYRSVWDLNIQGMLTLNIDGLAARGFRESAVSDRRLYDRNGFEIRTLIGTLTDNESRFIANLHGSPEDPMSWVFTEKKLQSLLADERYCEFVKDCVKYSTIVLLGISAHDRAVIAHFERATSEFPNCGPHFWITSADQQDAALQVEKAGIRTTLYSNRDGAHTFIQNLFDAVRKHKPEADTAAPVHQTHTSNSVQTIPALSELISKSPNEIRTILNSAAADILSGENDEAYNRFEAFCIEYSRAIHSANYVSQHPSENADTIGGYRAHKYVKEGGFAKVWYGSSEEGEPVAIKVFRHEIREQPDLLRAFRRGVRSMRFLEKKRIPGVVRFLDASEVPPVVVMEWVDGVTLHDAVRQGATRDWWQKLRIATELCRAVFAVHNTPERIVHRDLRPHNVMLRDFYSDRDTSQVVVLDFDLSWHLNALEKSVYISGGTAYLAPEQLYERPGMSTRSATVDSFGFGMTFLYIVTGADPTFFAHMQPDWEERVMTACTATPCKQWRSLPRRVSRLIVAATLDDQNARLTFGQILSEMEKLWTTIQSPTEVNDVSLVTEECFARVDTLSTYTLTQSGTYLYRSPSGVTFEADPHSNEDGILLKFSFIQAGHEKYQILDKIGNEFRCLRERLARQFDVLSATCNLNHGDFHADITVRHERSEDFVRRLSASLGEISKILINIAGAY